MKTDEEMTILVAVADDHIRDRVIDVAVELGRALDRELYVVHLVSEADAGIDAKRIRDDIRDRVADETVPVTVSLEHVGHMGARQGPRVGQELVEIATDVDISHIVIGHTSKPLVKNLTQGSAAFAVADTADVPVTVVPENVL